MTFDARERSRAKAEPTDLYLIRYGDADESRIAYTDAEEPITITQPTADGMGTEEITYQPFPIRRQAVTSSGSLDKAAMEVRMSESSPLADLFRGYPPSFVVLLTVRSGHRRDPANEWLVAWVGRILSCDYQDVEAVFSCEPTSTSMRRVGLRRHYQYGCPHWLYGPECRASKAAATKTVEMISVEGARVVVADGFNDKPLDKYLGGLATWKEGEQTHLRTIIRYVEDNAAGIVTFFLNGAATGAEEGEMIDLAYGCNHTMDDCQNLHVPSDEPVTEGGNIHNYGGQPFIPTKNPTGIVNQYY